MIEIQLTKGYVAIVDDEDADLAELSWQASVTTHDKTRVYATRMINANRKQRQERMHRIILSRVLGRVLERKELVDHVNGDSLDNRRSNLRVATILQNHVNSRVRKDNKSGYKGVKRCRRTGRWFAHIRVSRKMIYLGYFDTPEQANEAYYAAAVKYYGEFANPG